MSCVIPSALGRSSKCMNEATHAVLSPIALYYGCASCVEYFNYPSPVLGGWPIEVLPLEEFYLDRAERELRR